MSDAGLLLRPKHPSRFQRWGWFGLGFIAMVVISSRVTGPSDLYGHDQPKTVAYSVDMALHGRYVLPSDTEGHFATKPPMTNWLAQPTVGWLGIYSEWSLRSPALLGALATLGILMAMAHWLGGRPSTATSPTIAPMHLALLAGMIWLASYPASKMLYLARPDPVLCAWLLGGWASATRLLLAAPTVRRWPWALGLWLCVAGGALTKGPAGLVPAVYLLIAAPMLTGSFRPLLRSGWWWGLPLAIGLFGIWAVLAHREEPEHFRRTFLGVELLNRFTHVDNNTPTGPHQILTTAWKLPAWFAIRFLPWSIPFIGWVVSRLIGRMRRAAHHRSVFERLKALFEPTTNPMAPAVIWCGVVLVFFSGVAWKRADYLMPLYPVAAMIVARDLLGWRRRKLTAALTMATAFCVSLGIAAYWFSYCHAARTGHGRAVGRFAEEVRQKTGTERIVFEHSGYNGLQSLLGHHQGPPADDTWRREARWVIRKIENETDRRRAVVQSDRIIDRGDRLLHLGLFKKQNELKRPESDSATTGAL